MARDQDAFGDISISTIDAFCLSLLHEFPLEAGVDPGFDLADETETPRFIEASLDSALAIRRAVSLDDADVALLFTELGEPGFVCAVALLDRRLVAGRVEPIRARPRDDRRDGVAPGCRLRCAVRSHRSPAAPARLRAFAASGPDVAGFGLVALEIEQLMAPSTTLDAWRGPRSPACSPRACAAC